jgi:hypothetical protein
MFSKLLAFFRPDPLKNVEVKSAQTLSISSNDFLVITVESGINQAVLKNFQQRAREFFKSQNVLVVAGDDVRLLKVAIEDRMIDELMLKEEVTKWKN